MGKPITHAGFLEPARKAYGWFLWEYMAKFPDARNWLLFLLRKRHAIFIDYPVDPKPRYGHGRPPHERLHRIIDRNRARYARHLREFAALKDELLQIAVTAEPSGRAPGWRNSMLPGLDGVSIYGFLATMRPKRFVEVGSGNSTRFARCAVERRGLSTKIVSFDPFPSSGTELLCDELVRKPVEDVDPSAFDVLEPGDVFFVDNSHRSFMNSDVTTVFLDILPRLRPGIVVGIHDINLPLDYGPDDASRYYSEQYLLATYLLAEGSHLEIILPCAFVSRDPELSSVLDPLWSDPHMQGVQKHGGAFWFETR